jgi:hypothetical protein
MEPNKLKRSLEVFFEYSHRTIGTFIAIAAFWMYFSGTLSDRRFWLGLGAAVALGFFGPKANLDFFRGFLKQKSKDNATGSDDQA